MKRIVSFVLSVIMLLSLVSCAVVQDVVAELPDEQDEDVIDLVLEEDPAETEETDSQEAEAPDESTADASEIPVDAEAPTEEDASVEPETEEATLPEDGEYNSKEEVALYIHLYGHLPNNYITKKEAEKLGWNGGSLEPFAPGKSIGGSRFGNYEGILPKAKGRTYTECDIDTKGAKKRGAKRIVFSNDGLIYYTEDHYASFELLYGEE